jgi:hypothetical protein
VPRLRISGAHLCMPAWYAQGEIYFCVRRTEYLTSNLGGKVLKQLFPMSR